MNFQKLTGEVKRLEALVRLSLSRGQSGGPASFAQRQSVGGASGNVPTFNALSGGGTAGVINGSRTVTFSASQPAPWAPGDLILFAGNPIPYEIAAPGFAPPGQTVQLTAPFTGTTNPTIAATILGFSNAILVPAAITPLPASGWRLNVSGVFNAVNTNAASRNVRIYIAGASAYAGQTQFSADLPVQNQSMVIPFDLDLITAANTNPGAPYPTSFLARVFMYATNGGGGDVTVANNFMSVSRVG